jgi:hypothetical protein
MSLRTRRILFIFFILSFLIITPLVISYAAGYKFVFGKKVLQKTGMLVLDTEPTGAKIYLNGKPEQNLFKKYFSDQENFITTPAKIKNLLPGEYEIKMEKDGYWPWEKKLEVKPGMAAFAEDVYLFKKDLPLMLASKAFQEILLSPDKKKLAGLSEEKINIINLETEDIKEFSFKQEKTDSFFWSPDSKKILAGATVFNLASQPEKIELEMLIEKSALKLKWRGNNEIAYMPATSKNILSFNLETKINKNLYTGEKIIDFLIPRLRDNLFIINQTDKTNTLSINEIDGGKIIRNIELPSFADFEFINPEHNLINLYDKKQQTLYLINPFSNFPLAETINNIKYAYWINDNKLLYGNDFEIWTMDFPGEQTRYKTLITRISSPINKIIWHPSNNYIIYSDNNGLYALELDDREKRNTTELIKLNNIAFPNLNSDGTALYFYAQIGNQEGLYKLAIQ